MKPLVSIIIVCHNHGPFIQEAVESALAQTYPNIEVIVVDDCSEDQSVLRINTMEQQGLPFRKLLFNNPQGYCKAFNKGLSMAKGAYIIDLSGDDVLAPSRAEKGVSALENCAAGVDFCDVFYIDESSRVIGTHYRRDADGMLTDRVPEGDIFIEILQRYFVCAPSMVIQRQVFDTLEGYDESLYYEDFDFWVRSSRNYDYHFTNETLVKKRVLPGSMSKSQYQPGSRMLPSTLKVCQKAYELCRSREEYQALTKRLKYELRQSVLSNNYSVARELLSLLAKIEDHSISEKLWAWLIARQWNLSFLSLLIRKAR